MLSISLVLATSAGTAQANIYGYVEGDRVSVVIADEPPADSRYILFKKDQLGPVAKPADEPLFEAVLSPSKFRSHILSAAKETRVDAALIHAVITVESGYNPSARSSAGAVGLMQLMPGTARRYGVKNRLDPVQSIHGGARYLRDLKAMFDDDLRLVLAAYNAGEHAVIRYGRRIPPFRQTAAYVPKVLATYQKFRPAAAGG